VKRLGKREKRMNVANGLGSDKVIPPVVYGWTTKHVWFEDYNSLQNAIVDCFHSIWLYLVSKSAKIQYRRKSK